MKFQKVRGMQGWFGESKRHSLAKKGILSGDKLEMIHRLESEHRKQFRRSLLTQRELQQLAISSLYRKSPKQQEYIINKLFKIVLERSEKERMN